VQEPPTGRGISELATRGELATPDLTVPDWIHGPDLRLADNSEDPEILPGQACMAEHCRTMTPLMVLGVMGDVLSEVANLVNSVRRLVSQLAAKSGLRRFANKHNPCSQNPN